MRGALFARTALEQIPRILTLQDRNPHSPTYGCFDRNFWHYKVLDFPSGMAQEFSWPLALAWDTEMDGNPFYRDEAIREAVAAGVRYAARSSRADGSCDDYFPFERAAGAAAFSLLASVESCELVGIEDREVHDFLRRRASWLAGHRESGRLSNHEALIALCLHRVGEVTGETTWSEAREERLRRVLSWQHEEGWFQEYEGCDPGYLTLTLSVLARLHRDRPTDELRRALERAARVAAVFLHPDGSFGGEYGSRNTYCFFPHGFELVGRWVPEALEVNDRFLEGLARGLVPCYADDHIVGHHPWNYLLAYRDFVAHRPPPRERPRDRVHLRCAGLLVDRREGAELYVALNKGGTFKLFRNGELVASDTQFSILERGGRNAVGHLVGGYETRVPEEGIEVAGVLGWAKHEQMSAVRLLALRAGMLTVGRFFPDLVRRLLQRLLITGKKNAPYRFRRRFTWSEGSWVVRDELRAPRWEAVESVGSGGHQTSIYVAMSRTFQQGQLQPWRDLTERVRGLAPGEPLVVERRL